MTDEELSTRDKIMALYLKYGEREFDYIIGLGCFTLYGAGLLVDHNGKSKLTRKALKLIGKET